MIFDALLRDKSEFGEFEKEKAGLRFDAKIRGDELMLTMQDPSSYARFVARRASDESAKRTSADSHLAVSTAHEAQGRLRG